MAAAAANLKKVSLELGGNDAAIVLDDADFAAVVPRLCQGAFTRAGKTASRSSASTCRGAASMSSTSSCARSPTATGSATGSIRRPLSAR